MTIDPQPSLVRELDERLDEAERTLVALVAVSGVGRVQTDFGDAIYIPRNPWYWEPLANEHLPALERARSAVVAIEEICTKAIRLRAPEYEDDFTGHMKPLRAIVDRSSKGDGPPAGNPEAIEGHVIKAAQQIRDVLRYVLASTNQAQVEERFIVPDTNGLYWNPALEEWESDEPATLVLVPQTIRELDKHKDHHANENVRRKAKSLVRRFGELGKRGDTFAGVPLVGKLRFREIPIDPDPNSAPTWLRLDVDDDRLLATVLELRFRYPNASVQLATRDVNLRNKARHASVSVHDPPDPSVPEKGPPGKARPEPEVVLGHPGSTLRLGKTAEGKRQLIAVEPRYPIENKGTTGIRDVTTGVRSAAGEEHTFERYKAQLIGAGESSWVENVGTIPPELLDDVHESVGADSFVFWARFRDSDGRRWEVAYDAGTRTTEWRQPPDSASER